MSTFSLGFNACIILLENSVFFNRNDIVGILFAKDLVFADLEVGSACLLTLMHSVSHLPVLCCLNWFCLDLVRIVTFVL